MRLWARLLVLFTTLQTLGHGSGALEAVGPCGVCEGVTRQKDWLRFDAGTLYAKVQFDDSGRDYTGGHWGKLLAPYFAGRCLALSGNLSFAAEGTFGRVHRDPWTWFLPRNVRASSGSNCTLFREACACADWAHPAHCGALLSPTCRSLVQEEVLVATQFWAGHRGRSDLLRSYDRADVAIRISCSRETWLTSGGYEGPPAFSFYDGIVNTTATIFVVTDLLSAVNHPGCAARVQALRARLLLRHPKARSVTATGGDLIAQFAAMAAAPTLYQDNDSLSLWAGLAARGAVHSPGTAATAGSKPAPVLNARKAAELKISSGLQDVPKVIAWLERN